MSDKIVLVVSGVDVAAGEGYQDTIKVLEFISSIGLDVDSFEDGVWFVSPLRNGE